MAQKKISKDLSHSSNHKRVSKHKASPTKSSPQQILQRALAAPEKVSHDELLQLQSSLGNRVMRQVFREPQGNVLQAKRPSLTPFPQQKLIQRRMGGSKTRFKQLGGSVSFKSWAKGGTYNSLIDDLGSYEKAEAKGTHNVNNLDSMFTKASNWLDDADHVKDMRAEKEKAVGRARAMGYLMGKIAMERGMMGQNELLEENRPVIHLYMGQGIVGHLGEVILQSDEFSSCSPIVMFNDRTGIGGLYHFPAGQTKGLGSKSSHLTFMLAMAEAIQATDIYVHSGGYSIEKDKYLFIGERDQVRQLIEERRELKEEFETYFPNATVHEGSGRGSIDVTLDGSEVNITSTGTTERQRIKQSGGYRSATYDLATDAPPSNVIRFGVADAGAQWKLNFGENV